MIIDERIKRLIKLEKKELMPRPILEAWIQLLKQRRVTCPTLYYGTIVIYTERQVAMKYTGSRYYKDKSALWVNIAPQISDWQIRSLRKKLKKILKSM